MPKEPGFYFYSGDWLKDPLLRICSKSAKGCWIDMLAILDGCPFRGVFVTATGVPWSDEEVAGALGGDSAENVKAIEELLRKGVVSRNNKGAIYSRRMVRDQQKRDQDSSRKRKERRETRRKQKECVHTDVTQNVRALSEREVEREKEVGSLSVKVLPDSVEVKEFDCAKVTIISTDFGAQASFAAGYVVNHLEWTGKESRMTYEAQIIKQLKKLDGRTAEQIAEEMVQSWRLYRVASLGFRIKYGIANFFQKGIWCDRSQWSNVDDNRKPIRKTDKERNDDAFAESERRDRERAGSYSPAPESHD